MNKQFLFPVYLIRPFSPFSTPVSFNRWKEMYENLSASRVSEKELYHTGVLNSYFHIHHLLILAGHKDTQIYFLWDMFILLLNNTYITIIFHILQCLAHIIHPTGYFKTLSSLMSHNSLACLKNTFLANESAFQLEKPHSKSLQENK